MKTIRKHAVDTLVFAVAAVVATVWITGFFCVLIAELIRHAGD